jgi:hypothetical protein
VRTEGVGKGSVIFVFCSLLAIGAVGFTLLVRERDVPPAPLENPELKHLETRRQVLYDNLKDLQFEYHQGKLSDEDYRSLKSGFLYDLAGIMDAIERLQSSGRSAKGQPKSQAKAAGSTNTAVSGHRTDPANAGPVERVCASCGSANAPGNRFCGQCGAQLT